MDIFITQIAFMLFWIGTIVAFFWGTRLILKTPSNILLKTVLTLMYLLLFAQIFFSQEIGITPSETALDKGEKGIFGDWWPLAILANLAIILAIQITLHKQKNSATGSKK